MHSPAVLTFLAVFLFSIGVIGVIVRRNLITVFMCIELMLNSANLLLVAYSHFLKSIDGMMFVLFVLAIAAAEAGVGLALFVMLFRLKGNIDATKINILKN